MPKIVNYSAGSTQNTSMIPEHHKLINERSNTNIDSAARSDKNFSKILSKESAKISNKIEQKETNFKANNTSDSLATIKAESFKKAHTKKTRFTETHTGEAHILKDKNIIGKLAEQDGTDLARMREVAKELTDQFYGFLWAGMAEGVNKNPEGGFGEEMFQKSLWPELVKISSGNRPDKLKEAVIRDLVKSETKRLKNNN